MQRLLAAVLVISSLGAPALAKHVPDVYAHRGGKVRVPENTLLAFRVARRMGVPGIELDVRRAATGEVVVHHDRRVRLPGGRLVPVDRLSFAELRTADVGRGQRIPTLEEALRAAGPTMRVNIELKVGLFGRGLERAVARLVRDHGMEDRVVISSFNPLALWRMGRAAPELDLGFLVGPYTPSFLSGQAVARLLDTTSIHPHASLVSPATMERWRDLGLRVIPWTVNQPPHLRELARLGVHGIITDAPAPAHRMLARKAGRLSSPTAR